MSLDKVLKTEQLLAASFTLLAINLVSCFFSPTLKAISLVIGLLVWLIAIIVTKSQGQRVIDFFGGESYRTINLCLGIFLLSKFILSLVHGGSILQFAKSFLTSYLQWFWFASSIVYALKNKQQIFKLPAIQFLCLSFTSISTVSALIIFSQVLGLLPSHNNGTLGIMTQPFTNSGLILAGIFLSFYSLSQKFYSKRLAWLSITAQILAVLLLGQISAWFGLLVALVLLAWSRQWLNIQKVLLVLALSIACLLTISKVSPRIERKLAWFTDINKLTSNRSISCRFELWRQNYNQLQTNILLGSKKILPYYCQIKDKSTKLTHAHSIYFHKLFLGGVFGFVSWLILYLGFFFEIIRDKNPNKFYFLAYLTALSLEGLLENWWGDSEVLTIFLFMMAFARKTQLPTHSFVRSSQTK